MNFPEIYHNELAENVNVVERIVGHDGKVQMVYENGKKKVVF
jgi:hypothetical protein